MKRWTKTEREKLLYSVIARVGGVVGLLGAAIILPIVGTNAQSNNNTIQCASGYHIGNQIINYDDPNYPQGCNTPGIQNPEQCILRIDNLCIAPSDTDITQYRSQAIGYCNSLMIIPGTTGWRLPGHDNWRNVIYPIKSKIYGLNAVGSDKTDHYWTYWGGKVQNCRLDGECGQEDSEISLSVRCVSQCDNIISTSQYEGLECVSDEKEVVCRQQGKPINSSYITGNVIIRYNNGIWSTPSNCDWKCDTGYHKEGGECKINLYTLNIYREDGINMDPIQVEYGSYMLLPGYIDSDTMKGLVRYDSDEWSNKIGVGGQYFKYNYLTDSTIYGRMEDSGVGAILLPGNDFRGKLKELAGEYGNIKHILPINYMPDNNSGVLLSTADSPLPVYAWYESGTIYYYSIAINIILNSDSSNMFRDLTGLEELSLYNFDTSNVINMNSMFYNTKINGEIDMYGWDTSNVINMNSMFSGAQISGDINMNGWDTSNVINMNSMFYNTIINGNLEMNGWNPSNLTGMNSMFYNTKVNGDINMNGWDTSNVTNMNSMFNLAQIRGNLNMSGWNIENLTNVKLMFGRSVIDSINLSNWSSIISGNVDQMFYSTQINGNLNMSGWNTSNLTSISGLFYQGFYNRSRAVYCGSGKSRKKCGTETGTTYYPAVSISGNLNMNGWDVRNFDERDSIFKGVGSIGSLDMNNWNISEWTSVENLFGRLNVSGDVNMNYWDANNVNNIALMFRGYNSYTCRIRGNLNMNNWNVNNINSIYSILSGCQIDSDLNMNGWNTSNLRDTSYMFNKTYIGGALNMNGWDTSNVTTMKGMFSTNRSFNYYNNNLDDDDYRYCYNYYPSYDKTPRLLSVSGFNTSNVTDMSDMFAGMSNITGLDLSNFDTSNVTDMHDMFACMGGITGLDLSNFDTSNVTDMGGMFAGMSSITVLDLSGFDTSNVTNMHGMFYGMSSITALDLSGFDTSNVTDMSDMFAWMSSITGLDLSSLNTSNVTDMREMFYGMSSIAELDLSAFNTSNVTDMGGMFAQINNITGLDLSSFDTSNVTNMESMFYSMSGIIELDLSSFDTSNVYDIRHMFSDCPNLTTIYASNNFVTTNMEENRMFDNVPNLVGGAGTKAFKGGINYARIDNPRQMGFFTDKNAGYYISYYIGRNLYTYQAVGKEGGKATKPDDPVRAGYDFGGWYKDTGFTIEYNFNDTVTKTIKLYANMIYNGEGSDGEIIIERPDNISEGQDRYILMSLNIGQEEGYEGNIEDCGDEYGYGGRDEYCASEYYKSKYGYYYQWGNNHGFTITDSVGYDVVNTTCYTDDESEGGDCEEYSRENPYDVGEFVAGWPDWSLETNNELRGADTNTKESRQGPCPEGWHVPSVDERSGVIYYLSGGSNTSGGGNSINIVNRLGLGLGGKVRENDGLSISELENGYYWTTTINEDNDYSVYNLKVRDDGDRIIDDSYRRNGFLVRCFKNDINLCPEGYTMELGECINEMEVECVEEGAPENSTYFPGTTTISWNGENWTATGSCKWDCNQHYHKNGNQCDIDQYIVTFYDEDGETVLDTQTVDYGTGAIYGGDVPSKERTQQYTYTFDGWCTSVEGREEDNLGNVIDNRNVYAKYNSTINQYTVTFYDEDGETVLDTQTVDYGTGAIYGGDVPSKERTQQYTYTFDGWYTLMEGGDEDDLDYVIDDREVYARYNTTVNQYTVTFYDEDGETVLDTQTVDYGTGAIYGGDVPSKERTQQYTYTFDGWYTSMEGGEEDNLDSVIDDRNVYARYNSTVNQYTVIFYDEDGHTVLGESKYEYGTKASDIIKPEDPIKSADSRYTYTFNGWTGEISDVTENASYIATYTATKKPVQGNSGGGNNSKSEPDKQTEYLPEENNDNKIQEDIPQEGTHGSAEQKVGSIEGSEYSDELNEAYQYAYSVGITTMPTIQQANMMGPLLRKHLAKMVSEFAMQELGITPNTGKVCKFADTENEDQEMQYYTELACQLEFMGLHADGITVKDDFDPNDEVTRAEFGTVLSRLLWKTMYSAQTGELYYQRHLEALKDNGIMTQIYGNWPSSTELRGYVMLMLQRVSKMPNITGTHGVSQLDDDSQENNIDDGNIVITFNKGFKNGVMNTTGDYIHIVGAIDPSRPVETIKVSHSDTKGKATIKDYQLKKYDPQAHNFWFNAAIDYKSMTANDKNTYEFKFYDKDGKLLFKESVVINQKSK